MTIDTRGTTSDSAGRAEATAGQGRTARYVTDVAVLLTPPVLFAVPVPLIRAGLIDDGFVFLNMVSLFIAALVACYAHMGGRARPHDGGLLSARSLTGRHTIDLTRLTEVGRLEVPGEPRTDDRLVLTDAHGVRIVLDRLADSDETVDALVRKALLNRPPGAGVVVSDRAADSG